jgi:proliferating cell nuclear antigen PCNA|tara:strand:- start:173 stop:925 length:753 start_codon:yes stop_codon:yes gene_type:complete
MNCTWKDAASCLKIFKAVQHTNPMVNIDFDVHGVHIMAMDTSKTSLVQLELSSNYFENYSCTEPMTLGIYTETLTNILQKVKKDKLNWKSVNGNVLTIVCSVSDQKTEFSLRAIDIEEDTLAIPELQDNVAVIMDRDALKGVMDKILMGKTDMRVDIENKVMMLSSESTEFGKISHVEPIGGERVQQSAYLQDVHITLSFHATKSMFVFSGCGNGSCFIGFSNDMPSRLKVELGPGSSLCLYVAPKIQDE